MNELGRYTRVEAWTVYINTGPSICEPLLTLHNTTSLSLAPCFHCTCCDTLQLVILAEGVNLNNTLQYVADLTPSLRKPSQYIYTPLRSKSGVKFATLRGGKTIMKNAPITSIEVPEVMLWSRPSALYMHAGSTQGISLCTTFFPFLSNTQHARYLIKQRAGKLWLNRAILTSISVWC